MPGTLFLETDQPAELLITKDPSREKPSIFVLNPRTLPPPKIYGSEYHDPGVTQIIVSVGQNLYEDPVLEGKTARSFSEYLTSLTEDIRKFNVKGKKPAKIGLLCPFRASLNDFDMRKLASAIGFTGQYGTCQKEVYGPDGERFGFNRIVGYISLQNIHLSSRGTGRSCYEGDYEPLKKQYQKRMDELKQEGLEGLPQRIKLIEEAGAPSLVTLREWEKVNEKFRRYLKEKNVSVYDVLGIDVLEEMARGKKMTEEEMWQSVKLGTGSVEESVSRPVLYYHSHCFRALLFAENNRNATKLVEEIFPKGTITHSGSFFPSTGGQPALHSGVDPFYCFQKGE